MHTLRVGEREMLSLLRDAGGAATPQWAPRTERGYAYVVGNATVDEHALQNLAQNDFVRAIFFDRISRCPSCRSHLLNMREVCPTCKSAQVESAELLHHFRCGYVAPISELAPVDGARCPKCGVLLRHRGRDYDSPGPSFTCGGCGRIFGLPEIGAVCLRCGKNINGTELAKVICEDLFAYEITQAGLDALDLAKAPDAAEVTST